MRRAIEFCVWMASWWDSQKEKRVSLRPHVSEGVRAYALEQADSERRRSMEWSICWDNIRKRGRDVLEHLKVQDSPMTLSVLEVEINVDEYEDSLRDDGFF